MTTTLTSSMLLLWISQAPIDSANKVNVAPCCSTWSNWCQYIKHLLQLILNNRSIRSFRILKVSPAKSSSNIGNWWQVYPQNCPHQYLLSTTMSEVSISGSCLQRMKEVVVKGHLAAQCLETRKASGRTSLARASSSLEPINKNHAGKVSGEFWFPARARSNQFLYTSQS